MQPGTVTIAAGRVFAGLDLASLALLGGLVGVTIAIIAMQASAGFSLRYSARNLGRRWVRGAFAIIGIAVSISVVVAIVQGTRGIEAGVTSLLKGFRGDVLISQRSAVGMDNSRVAEGDLRERFEAIDGVARAEAYALRFVGLQFAGLGDEQLIRQIERLGVPVPELPAVVTAWEHDSLLLGKCENIDGSGPVSFSGPDAREMMLGARVASSLRDILDEIRNDERLPAAIRGLVDSPAIVGPLGYPDVLLDGERFTVSAVFETGTIQDLQVLIPLRAYQQALDAEDEVSAFVLHAEGAADIDAIVDEARDIVAEVGAPLAVRRPEELMDRFARDYSSLRSMILAIGLLAALAGAVSVGNTMMSNVHERTREIGLLRAVGWTRAMVLSTILTEGLLLSGIGGVIGLGLGVVELELAATITRYNPTPNGYEPFVMLLGLALSVALGIVGSLLPGLRAVRLAPVEAMRYE